MYLVFPVIVILIVLLQYLSCTYPITNGPILLMNSYRKKYSTVSKSDGLWTLNSDINIKLQTRKKPLLSFWDFSTWFQCCWVCNGYIIHNMMPLDVSSMLKPKKFKRHSLPVRDIKKRNHKFTNSRI